MIVCIILWFSFTLSGNTMLVAYVGGLLCHVDMYMDLKTTGSLLNLSAKASLQIQTTLSQLKSTFRTHSQVAGEDTIVIQRFLC